MHVLLIYRWQRISEMVWKFFKILCNYCGFHSLLKHQILTTKRRECKQRNEKECANVRLNLHTVFGLLVVHQFVIVIAKIGKMIPLDTEWYLFRWSKWPSRSLTPSSFTTQRIDNRRTRTVHLHMSPFSVYCKEVRAAFFLHHRFVHRFRLQMTSRRIIMLRKFREKAKK